MNTRQCWTCKEAKPLEAFNRDAAQPSGLSSQCKACHTRYERERRRNIPAEDKAEAMRAYRAGMRKDRCAICKAAIEGHGICDRCANAVAILGGLDGLKQAVRAWRYLNE